MTGSSGGGLFSGLFARGDSAAMTDDQAVLQAMLDFEAALLRALVASGLAPAQAADELAGAADARKFDLADLGRGAGEQGTPVPALLSALNARLSETARAYVHTGATSQDVLDTALMLVARRALAPILADLQQATQACAELAGAHRRTLLPGRTLLQQALPLSFGVKAAGWLVVLDDAARELAHVRADVLALQFGGAVGTLAPLGDRGLEVAGRLAQELELVAPDLPWHTNRSRPVRLACALGSALGGMGKVARDIVLLAQTEVGEVGEGGGEGRGGSSTMPHKRNPVGAVAVAACAGQAPGLVAAVLGAMPQEHERAPGAWQAEWEPLLALLRLAGSAADALAISLSGLQVDAAKMRTDLELTGASVMTESVVTALSPALGRHGAQRLVKEVTQRSQHEHTSIDRALRESEQVVDTLGETGIRRALEPEHYLGVSDALIDRALARLAKATP